MRIIIIGLFACVIQSATAAEIAVPTAPAPVFVAPDPYPSRFLKQGIFFELGARYWFSSGKYSKDLFNQDPSVGLVSRLTYSGLTTNAGEFFGSVKLVNGYFLKWNVGAGSTFGGELVDEDFSPFTVPLSRTTSAQRDGGLGYATLDLGYNVLSSPAWQVGPFVGVNFLRQTLNATGCVQAANNPVCVLDPTGLAVNGRVITERADWTSIRVGVNGEWNVTNQFKLSANAAWLPYVKLEAQDTHLLRQLTTPEFGTGTGVQLEAIASYALSDSFSVGVGGRYWYMQAQGRADFTAGAGSQPLTTKAERYGVFLQGTYTFALPEIGRRSPWLSCC